MHIFHTLPECCVSANPSLMDIHPSWASYMCHLKLWLLILYAYFVVQVQVNCRYWTIHYDSCFICSVSSLCWTFSLACFSNSKYCFILVVSIFHWTSGSAARHLSLYLVLRARPWLRMSQSYWPQRCWHNARVVCCSTVCSRTESWQWVGWNVAT